MNEVKLDTSEILRYFSNIKIPFKNLITNEDYFPPVITSNVWKTGI